MDAIRLHDLTLGYDGHPAVHHLEGGFASGSLTAIAGPNGSGKSTLLKGIMGILKPLTGRIELGGDGVADIAYLPQSAEIDKSFPASVTDMAALGLWRKRGPFGGLTRQDRAAVADAIETVGLSGFERRGLDSLSGGQLQRALFARVLVQDCKIIVMDEPFAAIDERTVADLLALIRRWHEDGRTVIAVLHDFDLVRSAFPQTLLMAREAIGWGRTEDVLTAENLGKARRMNEAWDEQAPWHDVHDHHEHQHGAHEHVGHEHQHRHSEDR